MAAMITLLLTFLLPLLLSASIIDPYHDHGGRAAVSHQSTSYSASGRGNAGIWDNTDWRKLANEELARAIQVTSEINNNKAKNVIMFIGDGMGVSTLAAARLYNAENRNLKQSDIYLAWEKFPHAGFSRTYNVDKSTPDSAGTGTAYLCGIKANMETIGVTDQVQANNCSAVNDETKVRSILKESIAAGKWTGVVTTTRITHASPAASYAHVAQRDWEAYMPSDVSGQEQCDDIAKQLVEDEENRKIRVILGGGRQMFIPKTSNPEYNNEKGKREDNRDLIKDWQTNHTTGRFVMNRTQFADIDPLTTDYLFGLFSSSHMSFEADRDHVAQPSLSEMTEKAIKMLQRSPNGYFLFVEGGRIDQSHHDGNAFKALNDTIALSDAVQKAISLTDAKDTLIIVSADHSHVFTFGGYGSFKLSVFDVTDDAVGQDGKPFLQMHYANGPGFKYHRTVSNSLKSPEIPRIDLTGLDTGDQEFLQDAAVPKSSETHGGEDVGIFASGPMAHLIHGVHEQNYIGRLMMYASCVGNDLGPHCSPPPAVTPPSSSSSSSPSPSPSSSSSGSIATTQFVNLFLAVAAASFSSLL